MKRSKWIYYVAGGFAYLVYIVGEATDLLALAMLIVLPLGCWVIWGLIPDKPE